MADVRLTATNPEDSSVVPVACNEKGELKLEEPLVVEGPPGQKGEKGDKGDPGDSFDGNHQGNFTVSGNIQINGGIDGAGASIFSDGRIYGKTVYAQGSVGNGILFQGLQSNGFQVFRLGIDGSVLFAGNKAGFTAEGYLWCTTRRGDIVMLDVTSNGLASWVPYTPPNRITELQDKWAEKDGILPVPHDSSQDGPEITQ